MDERKTEMQEVNERIDKTVEAQRDYRDYIQEQEEKQFQRTLRKQEENIEQDFKSTEPQAKIEQKEVKQDDEENPELDEFTARVIEVDFCRDKIGVEKGIHIIKFEDVQGEKHTARIETGHPSDKHNKYVRLCEYVGVNPINPLELRKKIIPVKTSNDKVKIDYPPVQKRLNPYYYRLRRGCFKLAKAIDSRRKVKQSLLWIGIAVGFPLPAIGFVSTFIFMSWINKATGEIFTYAMALPTLIAYVGVGGLCFYLYGKTLQILAKKASSIIASGLVKIRNFLFPKTES